MKLVNKIAAVCALAGAVFLSSCATASYVTEQPVAPVYVRPAAPYVNAYWVPGEWIWRGNRYVYRNGYYARPRFNRAYIQGAWVHGPRGYAWRRGHWR